MMRKKGEKQFYAPRLFPAAHFLVAQPKKFGEKVIQLLCWHNHLELEHWTTLKPNDTFMHYKTPLLCYHIYGEWKGPFVYLNIFFSEILYKYFIFADFLVRRFFFLLKKKTRINSRKNNKKTKQIWCIRLKKNSMWYINLFFIFFLTCLPIWYIAFGLFSSYFVSTRVHSLSFHSMKFHIRVHVYCILYYIGAMFYSKQFNQ